MVYKSFLYVFHIRMLHHIPPLYSRIHTYTVSMFRRRLEQTSLAKESAFASEHSRDDSWQLKHTTATALSTDSAQSPVQHSAAAASTSDISSRQDSFYQYYYSPVLSTVPMYFAIFYVIYIGALVIKAAAHHRILYSRSLTSPQLYIDELAARVNKELASAAFKYARSLYINNSGHSGHVYHYVYVD